MVIKMISQKKKWHDLWNNGCTGIINQIGQLDLQKDALLPSPQGQRKQLVPFRSSKFPEHTVSGRERYSVPLCISPWPKHKATHSRYVAEGGANDNTHSTPSRRSEPKVPRSQLLPLLWVYHHWSCHWRWRGRTVTGPEAPHTGSSCAQPEWEAPGRLGTALPPSTHSSLRGKGRSGAGPRRSGKTHPAAPRSATRNKGGRTQFLLTMIWHLHTCSKAKISSTASDEVPYTQCPVICCCVAKHPKEWWLTTAKSYYLSPLCGLAGWMCWFHLGSLTEAQWAGRLEGAGLGHWTPGPFSQRASSRLGVLIGLGW